MITRIPYLVLSALIAVGGGALYVHAQEETAVMQPVEEEYVVAPVSETEVAQSPEPVLYYFYSPTCVHCRKQHVFLDRIEKEYPELEVFRYEAGDPAHQPRMVELAREHDAMRFLGQVPLTFVNGEFFVGYDSDETTGVEIENAIRTVMGLSPLTTGEVRAGGINVPILGTVYPEEYSLAGLAVILGFLDGFNVCSLGALILIIGFALKMQRRKTILLFGGTFIVTTSLIYGGLIVAWYHIFDLFSGYIDLMKIGVALISLAGGLYFLKEYLRMRKQGAVCELTESTFINDLMRRTGDALKDKTRLMTVVGIVFLFAAVITIVEFPCSAAVPVVFAGMLAEAGLSTFSYLAHIGLFVLFYMLDELLVFGVAVYRLKLWMANGSFTKWAVLAEAVILLGIGAWYLGAVTGLL